LEANVSYTANSIPAWATNRGIGRGREERKKEKESKKTQRLFLLCIFEVLNLCMLLCSLQKIRIAIALCRILLGLIDLMFVRSIGQCQAK
jgi:hypothetical protein